MGPVYLAARSLSGETRYSLSRPSDFKRANADVCLATSPLRITDGRMWGRELPGGHRREREDALANPDEQFVGPMPSCKANDELSRVRDHLTGQRDEIDADRFHAPRGPFGSQDQPLHRRVEVHGDDHDRPPRSIHTEKSGGHFAAGQIVFHHRMRFFAHAAAFALPTNECVARHRQTIGDQAEEFIASSIANSSVGNGNGAVTCGRSSWRSGSRSEERRVGRECKFPGSSYYS